MFRTGPAAAACRERRSAGPSATLHEGAALDASYQVPKSLPAGRLVREPLRPRSGPAQAVANRLREFPTRRCGMEYPDQASASVWSMGGPEDE